MHRSCSIRCGPGCNWAGWTVARRALAGGPCSLAGCAALCVPALCLKYSATSMFEAQELGATCHRRVSSLPPVPPPPPLTLVQHSVSLASPPCHQFKKGKKRAKAQEEAETLYGSGPNSALCIALAKMHMTLAVEQVC